MLRPFLSRLASTKPTPSKIHFHQPIPSDAFPKGYLLTGMHCGVKKDPSKLDLGLILSTSSSPTHAAACFTRNAFQAAPVLVSQDVLARSGGKARAIVVNSGCANAVTGKQGLEDAWRMVNETDALISSISPLSSSSSSPPSSPSSSPPQTEPPQSLVMSTGVIGQTLPISKIISAVRSQHPSFTETSTNTLGSDFAAWERAATAFMTTDTFPKLRARSFTINGTTYRMAGMDKGAGMIHPNMGPPTTTGSASGSPPAGLHATLLGCILTDAAVSPQSLQSALTYAVERSFNSISVDGDMSTNDTILVLANGAAATATADDLAANLGVAANIAGVADAVGVVAGLDNIIDEVTNKEGYEVFKHELTALAMELAQLVVRDGEGATKFVTVSVKGAATYEDAHKIASSISTSSLVKTALYGEDANWGRILSSTGSVQHQLSTPLNLSTISVTFHPSSSSSPLNDPSQSQKLPDPLPVLIRGEPIPMDETHAKQLLSLDEFEIVVDLNDDDVDGAGRENYGKKGGEDATYWTCDLSYEYVRINGDYRS